MLQSLDADDFVECVKDYIKLSAFIHKRVNVISMTNVSIHSCHHKIYAQCLIKYINDNTITCAEHNIVCEPKTVDVKSFSINLDGIVTHDR